MRWILLAPLLVVLVLFGLSNREAAQLHLWPFDLVWSAPLSVAMLVFGALCFLLGAGVAWASGLGHRLRARRAEAAAGVLRAELSEYRAELAKRIGPVPPPAGANLARLPRAAA